LEKYELLRQESVGTSPAIEYISEHYEIDSKELDLESRYELLILLHEQGLAEILDELVARAKMRTYSETRRYVLEEDIDLGGLNNGLFEFHRYWNEDSKDDGFVLVENEFQSEDLAVLKIHRESGLQSSRRSDSVKRNWRRHLLSQSLRQLIITS
jgi:hypothetical protein